MRKMLVFAMILTLVGSAMAFDLGSEKAAKPAVNYIPTAPAGTRQGGDTLLDAVVVALPYAGTGTTVGFMDDYDEACPYTGSTSPDVVYSFTPAADGGVNIDLFGSDYDTKVFVYDAAMALIACNDDFHSDYTSKLENMPVVAGTEYFVVVDGYGGASGNYVIAIDEFEPCVIECPADAALEGEPALADGYEDLYNGGCNTEGTTPFGVIETATFCGVSGWYISADGAETRDTDWFEIVLPESGVLEITGDAEFATYLFELGPTDCASVAVIQDVTVGPCMEGSMTIAGTAGDTVWFWVGPTTYTGPVNEYNYVLYTNLEGIIATETHSLSSVKALFN